jgi:predicted phosphodiesterase
MKLALKGADTQIGFRRLTDGTLDPFHDNTAMDVFIQAAARLQPDKIQILGDFLDLASQGRFAQEAAFANTTQEALNAGHIFLARLRAFCPNAEIIIIEGNHDKRMQNFIEANALAAFGLKRANMPDSWPTQSLPYLLRLDELNIQYVDAYPAATDWDNDTTRNIHGTKANSRGSTTSQYVFELPHLNTWAGHTHRVEITYRSVTGARGKAVESYSANPGCLCRVDGAVPSVNGAIGADGTPARVVENWQQGFGLAYYNDTESWPSVYRIRDGIALIDGMEIAA